MDETQTESTESKEQEGAIPNTENGVPGENEGISPLEEARKLNEDNKVLLKQISEERKRIEKATAEMLVNGKTFAGQRQKTAEEIKREEAQKEANEIVNAFKSNA